MYRLNRQTWVQNIHEGSEHSYTQRQAKRASPVVDLSWQRYIGAPAWRQSRDISGVCWHVQLPCLDRWQLTSRICHGAKGGGWCCDGSRSPLAWWMGEGGLGSGDASVVKVAPRIGGVPGLRPRSV